jgi:hypothetical protein
MRLYVNSNGQWAGTQAEAKKIDANLIEVPTDKPGLIAFLNGQQNNSAAETIQPTARPGKKQKQHISHELFEVANRASLPELQAVVYRYLMQVDVALDLKTKNKISEV